MSLKVGLRGMWKGFREEVALELKLKFQAEQKASAPNQTVDTLVKSGFWLQMLFKKVFQLFCLLLLTFPQQRRIKKIQK